MAKLVLYSGVSIDQYIARPNGDFDWLDYPEYVMKGEDFGYSTFIEAIGTNIMGNTTYQQLLSFDGPFPYPNQKNYILSRSPGEDTEHVTYIREDAIAFLTDLKETEQKDIWVIGGGQIDSLVLNAGLVDAIIITIVPLVLGAGIRFFEGQTIEQKFTLKTHTVFKNGFVQLEYLKSEF